MASKRNRPALRGAMTALVTPFRKGEIDWGRVEMLVERQIEGGTDWLVPLGTTGESPTLTEDEYKRLLGAIVKCSDGRCPVMAGTGSNNTAEAVKRTQFAEAAGAKAVLVVAPCYNRPTNEGLFQHYSAVAKATDLPVVLYNVPARTGIDIDTDVTVRLRESFPNIVAIKDASGRLDRVTDLQNRCDIDILSGDDVYTWPFMALGAVGVISVVANLFPGLMKSLVTAASAGQMAEALRIHRTVNDLANKLGRLGPNPIPIKTAMAVAGLIEAEFRLPLCPLDEESVGAVKDILQSMELHDAVLA